MWKHNTTNLRSTHGGRHTDAGSTSDGVFEHDGQTPARRSDRLAAAVHRGNEAAFEMRNKNVEIRQQIYDRIGCLSRVRDKAMYVRHSNSVAKPHKKSIANNHNTTLTLGSGHGDVNVFGIDLQRSYHPHRDRHIANHNLTVRTKDVAWLKNGKENMLDVLNNWNFNSQWHNTQIE